MTGPSPVDRGKPGSKLHVLSEATGLPMATGTSEGNTADGEAMIPLVNAIPPIRSRRGPRRRKPAKLHDDKAYNSRERRRWLRDKGIRPRLARKDIEPKERFGRHRWVIERSMAWFTGYRRLTLRYELRTPLRHLQSLPRPGRCPRLLQATQKHQMRRALRAEQLAR
ncbi:hypothetical protein GCM10020366_53440 [Saccharopolyspora gregorii]|uniref:Transposase IS4-like domain-containing protein n=1 Tax=Saccharopolyspora gregorii TaxID=33914 RepID=A0ABP6RY00_9PSEU